MAFCSECGAQLPDGSAFCNNCGTAQGLQQNMQAAQGAGAPQMQPQPQYGGQPQQAPYQPPQNGGAPPAGGNGGGNKGLVIGLFIGVVALLAVVAVLGIKLLSGGGSTQAETSDTAKTTDIAKTEATTEPVQEEQPDIEQVLAAYAKTLRETETTEYLASYASFGMGYVDDDDVPELFVAEADDHPTGIRIYSYKDGEVTDHGYFGEFGGGMGYLPREGFISSFYMGMGVMSISRFRLEDGTLTTLERVVSEEVYNENSGDFDIVYYIDEEVVTEEEYSRRADAYDDRRDDFMAPDITSMTLFEGTSDYVEALRPYLDEAYLREAIENAMKQYEVAGRTISVGDYYGYTIVLPEDWSDKIEYTTEPADNEDGYALDTDVTFYLKEEHQAANGNGGMLFTLSILYKPWELPVRYDILGTLVMDGYSTYYLCAVYPGDVQFSTKEAREEAQAFYDETDAFFDTVDFGAAATWFYVPAVAGHRQEELYNQIRYNYMLSAAEAMDEDEIRELGLSTCYFDLAGTAVEEENMQCAITDLNDDGTNELVMLYDYEARAIHSIGEDGVPVLVYTCPYRSEMKIMEDNTIRVTSSVDGSVRYYRMTADLSGLVDAGSSQTEEEAFLYPFDISPAAYRGFDGDSSGDYAFGSKGIQVFGGWYENIYAGVTVNIWDQMTGIEFAFSEEDNSLICSCEYDGEKNRLVFDGTDYATDDRATASGYVERTDDGIKVTFTSSSVKWIESGASYTLQQTE